MELTHEQSVKQAEILKRIQDAMKELDVDYLQEAITQMNDSNSFREAGLIMAPNPSMQMAKNDLNAIKLKQLRLYVDAAMNLQEIAVAEIKVHASHSNSDILRNIFG